jgi:hypothetical protein
MGDTIGLALGASWMRRRLGSATGTADISVLLAAREKAKRRGSGLLHSDT